MDPFDFFNSDSESSEDEIYERSSTGSSNNPEISTDMSFNYDQTIPRSPETVAKGAFPKNIINKLMHRETHGFFSPNHNLRKFDKVPAENCLRLSEILPKSYPRNSHVCMGLTRCGNFLITYTLQPEMGSHFDENYHYQLHWWRFVPHRRCVKVSSTELFRSRKVDVELHITVCQWPGDNSRLLVYGFDTDPEQGGRAHVSVLTVPAVARCAACQRTGASPGVESDREGPCLRHGLAVHASFDYVAPCPRFNARLSLKRNGLVIVNIGHLFHVLEVTLDTPPQNQPLATGPSSPSGAAEATTAEADWSDDENALLRMLDQNFLDVNHELSIACADYQDPAYRVRGSPDSPEEPRLAEVGRPRERDASKERRHRFTNLAETNLGPAPNAGKTSGKAARPARAETVYEFRDDDESVERLADLRRRRLADKRYAFCEVDCEDAENIVPYRRCLDKQCDRLLSPPPPLPSSPQPSANRGKATPTFQVSTNKNADRGKTTPTFQVSTNKNADRGKTTPTFQVSTNKITDRGKATPTCQVSANKITDRGKAMPTFQVSANKTTERTKALPPGLNRLKSPPPNKNKIKSPPHFDYDIKSPPLNENRSRDAMKSPPPNQNRRDNLKSPPPGAKQHENVRSPPSGKSRDRILSPPPHDKPRGGGKEGGGKEGGVSSMSAGVKSPPPHVNRAGRDGFGSAPPKQYGSGFGADKGRARIMSPPTVGGANQGRARARTSPPLLSPPLENSWVLRPVNRNITALKALCAAAKPSREAVEVPAREEPLLPIAGRPPAATSKYTTLFDRHYVERDKTRPADPTDNDEEEGEAPAYQFALLMVVLGARGEPLQLATTLKPGKPGAPGVTVRQKSLDVELFLNDVGEAVCTQIGVLFSCCADYLVDMVDVCPVSGEAWCEARLRLKFRSRRDVVCRFGDCGCSFVLNADTGQVGVVSVTSLVYSGVEGCETGQLRAPPRGPRTAPLPSADRVRVINNEGTLRYVSFTSLVDLDNLIEIRL